MIDIDQSMKATEHSSFHARNSVRDRRFVSWCRRCVDMKTAGTHAFVDDGTGRCRVRLGGHGRYPLCDQVAGNDVHDW